MARSKIVARMTVRKLDDTRITVEVHSDAGHHNFYHWYKGKGRGRKFLRHSHRTDGQALFRHPIGLEVLAKRFPHAKVKITILRKRLYKRLLTCDTTALPGYKRVTSGGDLLRFERHRIAVAISVPLRREDVPA